MKKILTLLVFCGGFIAAMAQNGDISGIVKDETNEGMIGVAIQVLNAQGSPTGVGTVTDMDGRFTIKPLSAGKYNLKISYVGYTAQIMNQIIVNTDKSTSLQVSLKPAGKELNEVVIITYKKPIIDAKETKIEQIQTKDDIKNTGGISVENIANQSAGVTQSDPNKGITINGGREEEVQYIVNGHRMISKPNISIAAIKEISILTGGISAKYGDVTAGVVSITLNDAQENFSASVAGQTTKGLDAFGSSRISADISTPIIKLKNKDAKDTKRTLIGISTSFQYVHDDDRTPSAIGIWRVKDSVLNDIKKAPLYRNPNGPGFYQKGEDITFPQLYKTAMKAFNRENNYSGSGELGIYPSKNISLAAGGTLNFRNYYSYVRDYAMFNSENDPLYKGYDVFLYGRFTQRFGTKKPKDKDGEKGKNASKRLVVENAFYTVQFDYERYKIGYEDDTHGNNLFNYGYIGQFRTGTATNFTYHKDDNQFVYKGQKITGYVQEGTKDTGVAFKPGTINPLGTVFTEQYYQQLGATKDQDGFYDIKDSRKVGFAQSITDVSQGGALINGQRSNPLYSLWYNVGRQYNGYGVANNDESYRGKIEGAFDVLKLGSSNLDKHTIELGLEYEQRIQRNYDVNPLNLWDVAKLKVNTHISQDSGNAIARINGKDYAWNDPNRPQFYNTDTLKFADKANSQTQTYFDKSLRQKMGWRTDTTAKIDIYNVDPKYLSIDLFTADDLISYVPSQGSTSIVHYKGYDYKGNVLTNNPSLNDFFTKKDAAGNYTREQSAFMPRYAAGYIQDRFFYKGLGFTLGLRVDQYDANQSVLKDPYSLYEGKKAGDLKNITLPSNIGANFIPYIKQNTTDDSKREIVGFRDPETEKFYDRYGREETGQRLKNESPNGLLPYLNLPNNIQDTMSQAQAASYIKSANYDPKTSFTNYKAVWNVMPRIQLAFNISDQAQFFAHYDILTQRPSGVSNNSPISRNSLDLAEYYYFTDYTAIKNNPNLQPVRKVDYEFGFKQQVAKFASVTVSAFYQEASGLVQLRKIQYAFPNDYTTYDNIDFRTTKGAKIILDMRRYQNLKVTANYTLLFAEGTGSDDNSQFYLVTSGTPNFRQVFPISTDNRHTVKLNLDYRFGSGREGDGRYNGPRTKSGYEILSNFGINLSFLTYSGSPTRTSSTPVAEAIINGGGHKNTTSLDARLPWYFRGDLRVNKDFSINMGKKKEGKEPRALGLSVYVYIQNLFNNINVLDQYAYTSNANDDGYLKDVSSQSTIASNRNQESYRTLYQTRVNNPDNYGSPRRIYLGGTLTF